MNRGRFTTMAVGVGIAGALGALGLERTRAEPESARLPERPLPVPTEGFIPIEPAYTYRTAPQPHLVVVPAHDATERTVAWLREVAPRADLVMSVCTGAFVVAD